MDCQLSKTIIYESISIINEINPQESSTLPSRKIPAYMKQVMEWVDYFLSIKVRIGLRRNINEVKKRHIAEPRSKCSHSTSPKSARKLHRETLTPQWRNQTTLCAGYQISASHQGASGHLLCPGIDT
jgi:hypothetical protein